MKYLIAIYALVAILTFGSAWNHNPYTSSNRADDDSMNITSSMTCSLLWPLYWSYRIFEVTRKGEG